MAIRDAEGFSLDNVADTAGSGVTAVRKVTQIEETTYVEDSQGVRKTYVPATGVLMVEPIPQEPWRPLQFGENIGNDGHIYREGKIQLPPGARSDSQQKYLEAEASEFKRCQQLGLSPTELARGYFNDGTLVRDGKGRIMRVCGIDVDYGTGTIRGQHTGLV